MYRGGKKNNKMKTQRTRRESTIIRDRQVHELYRRIRAELGELATVVAKGYYYERIRVETGLNERTIANILNHTEDGN